MDVLRFRESEQQYTKNERASLRASLREDLISSLVEFEQPSNRRT